MKSTITTNAPEEYDEFMSFTTKEIKKVIIAGIKKGLALIRTAGRASLRSAMGSAASHHNPKYNDTLIQGVRNTRVIDKNDGNPYGYVTITSNRKAGSGSYRLIFFEGGTVQRFTSKGYNRGSLKALFFFSDAVSQTEGQVQTAIDNGISDAVDKINRRKND